MKPLGGVTVRVLPDGPSTTTAADGSYALAPPGAAVSVAAAKYGYAQQTATVTVATASDQMVNFALSSQPTGSVKGTVQRSLTGTLAGADVSILDAPFTAVTGSRGTYSFSKVATGPAVVRVQYPGLIDHHAGDDRRWQGRIGELLPAARAVLRRCRAGSGLDPLGSDR